MIAPRLEWALPEPFPDPPAFVGFDRPVATLLARRGFRDDAQLQAFLGAGAETLHPIALMADAERALDRIEVAIDGGQRIAIWGDYDADGMSAIAVWVVALRELGVTVERYVPSRWAEGYGLSRAGLKTLASRGVALVITCDCGVSNVDEVEVARALGLEVIVTDHHLPGPILPRAVAVVDPHRVDCDYPDPDLTGAGLAYKLAFALLARRGVAASDLAGIAAIGTVADLAPMTGESRAIVRMGLAELGTTGRAGLRALLARAAEHPEQPTARDLGYAIAPRVNAAGRIADAELAIALLVADDPDDAERLADELEAVHRRRRELTTAAVSEGRRVAGDAVEGGGPLVLRNDDWAPGLIGLIAGRLTDELSRPVAIVTLVGDELRGSVRAPADFNVAAALNACAAHLTKLGGHAAAGGFSVAIGEWERFVAAFQGLERPYPVGAPASFVSTGAVSVDLVLPSSHLGWELAAQLHRLEPFGPGHVEPILAVTGMRVADARRIGATEAHIAFRMRRGLEAFDAVAFGVPAERPLPAPGAAIDLVGMLEHDTFQGLERLRLRVLDYADSAASPLVARRRTVGAPMEAVAAR
ncbi:MAG: single-stranded-DNA-specific exonuclease RecJ [Chloroflexota bacterium]|nr:single-stranded-DNA-specific exonuclease RecJ [Chloroflexota bacterium]